MSSHREAPSICKDPVADNTDTYAFRSAGNTVTFIANFIPSQAPAAGPNFFEFGDDVLYEIYINTSGNAKPNLTYQFRFSTTVAKPNTFLYNTGPIDSLTSGNWNRKQTYTVTKVQANHQGQTATNVIGNNVKCPPCNIGPRSTPNYAQLAKSAVTTLPGGEKVFCGQRQDPFYVDLGSVFDLGTLRPVQNLHLISTAAAPGVDSLENASVHTIAIQVPISHVTRDATTPTDPALRKSVIGVWAAASRQRGSVQQDDGTISSAGPWVQVSRLGNPLFNEVIVPMAKKDYWNRVKAHEDSQFSQHVKQPELAGLLPVLYPGTFPNLDAYTADRADLMAILMTGIPSGIVPGFQNYTGPVESDMLRLNVAIPPTGSPNRLGLVGGDAAGFPNGRRLTDDIVTIEFAAVAGATIPLVDAGYTPDGAAGAIEDGTFNNPGRALLAQFPYVGTPKSGYNVP